MTPQDLVNLMTQTGPFKIPLTFVTFEAIRGLTEQEAQSIRNLQKGAKLDRLNAQKDELTLKLSEVKAEIAEAELDQPADVNP